MHACPHCQAHSISAWRKFDAASTRPARCAQCGGLSYVAFRGWRVITAAMPELLFWGSILLALALRSAWWLLAFPLGMVGLVYANNAVTVLQPIQADAVTAARWSVLRHVAIGASCVLLAYLALGRP